MADTVVGKVSRRSDSGTSLLLLYKVKVMVFRLRFDNPMSIPVATAVGITPFLRTHGDVRIETLRYLRRHSHVILPSWPFLGLEPIAPHLPHDRGETELHDHMCTGHKQRILKSIVLWGKHPLVVDGQHRSEYVPVILGEFRNENNGREQGTHHKRTNIPVTAADLRYLALRSLLSVSSSIDTSISID